MALQVASASAFISVHYLLNQAMDFDQTCIGIVAERTDYIVVTLTLFSMSKTWFQCVIF